MTLKLAQFCDDPQKISTKCSYPKKIFIFLKTPNNIEIQNFEPKTKARAYVSVKISEYPPPLGAGPPPPPHTHTHTHTTNQHGPPFKHSMIQCWAIIGQPANVVSLVGR